MTDQEEVNRAVAVINTAIRHGMFPAGVMPESDADKLTECEKLVVLCNQAKTVADAIGPTKVNNYQAVMDILMQADVLVGANGDGTQPFVQQPPQPAQEAQPSTSSSQPSPQAPQPPASSPADPTTSGSAPAGQQLTPSPASSASSSPPTSSPEQAAPAAPHPVDPDGILAQPRINEEWEATGGGRWLVVGDQGAMVDAVSRATGERTVLPKGFLKTKMTEAFIVAEVDPEWNLPDAKGYNKLWYKHPGCVKWYVPNDDMPLPVVGALVQCVTCDAELPIMSVEAHSYVPKPVEQPAQEVVSIEVPAPDQPVKLHEIHLTAHPDRGVKVFEHPGCSQWETPLDGKPLLPVGVSGPCPTCGDKNVPLTVSEPNGYDPATYKPPVPQPVQPQPAQEAAPSTPSPPTSSPSPPASSPDALSSSSSAPSVQAPTSTASATVSPPSSPPSSQPSGSVTSSDAERSTGAPVDNDDGDAEYRAILDRAEADFLPAGMPAPQDLESPPPAMPEDLTANPEANRELHSKFNALAARARYLAKIDERVARDCGRAVRLRLRPHMAKAKKELGASSTLTERREWAEEIGGKDVEVWLERQKRHADRAEAYAEFFSIYSANVAVLSRDLSWAQNEERGS